MGYMHDKKVERKKLQRQAEQAKVEKYTKIVNRDIKHLPEAIKNVSESLDTDKRGNFNCSYDYFYNDKKGNEHSIEYTFLPCPIGIVAYEDRDEKGRMRTYIRPEEVFANELTAEDLDEDMINYSDNAILVCIDSEQGTTAIVMDRECNPLGISFTDGFDDEYSFGESKLEEDAITKKYVIEDSLNPDGSLRLTNKKQIQELEDFQTQAQDVLLDIYSAYAWGGDLGKVDMKEVQDTIDVKRKYIYEKGVLDGLIEPEEAEDGNEL